MLTWIGQHHTRDLVRLETRTGYAVTTDGDDYHRYLRGEDVPNADAKAPWLARLAKDTASGHIWRKVHLVCGPLTDYQRYEFEWGFAYNVTAGEQIRILEVTDPNEAELIAALGDFSVLDGKHVLRNHYDTADQFLGGEVIYASEAAALSLLIGRLWDAAEPFESWWNRHPQYHRAHSAA
ncbi:MAG: hypothetical protein JO287_10810 [Pseudonocardiales bacterium]|nr:hypothetical protein [Pseudonocardiales bacterium]